MIIIDNIANNCSVLKIEMMEVQLKMLVILIFLLLFYF